jgi:hypothetical protein
LSPRLKNLIRTMTKKHKVLKTALGTSQKTVPKAS